MHDGGFLCNQLFYLLAHRSLETGPQIGFLHLPSLPKQGYGQGLSLERQLVAVQAVLNRLCDGLKVEIVGRDISRLSGSK